MFTRYLVALLAMPLLLNAADPDKAIVRYTPMEAAPRSVYVPLSENLHLAFDMDFLRIHTAWVGDGLTVNGTPHRSRKTPFTSIVEGAPFHTTPTLHGWSIGENPKFFQDQLPERAQFKGTRLQKGVTTFLFNIANADGATVAIEQSVHAIPGTDVGLGQVFRIGPSTETIYHAFQITEQNQPLHTSSDGEILLAPFPNSSSAYAADSTDAVRIVTVHVSGSYTVHRNVENRGASDLKTKKQSGTFQYYFLQIPPSEQERIVNLICIRQPTVVTKQKDFESVRKILNGFTKHISTLPETPKAAESHAVSEMKIRPPRGDDYYSIESFPLPPEVELKVTGMDWLPNGDLAVCTWPGEIWIVENHSGDIADVTYRLFAEGLNEPQGLVVVDGEIVVAQKPELTRVLDTNGDGRADIFECINNDWDHTGNYDAFIFGPVVDSDGHFYVTSPGQRARQDVKYAGWTLRISPDGSSVKGISSGHRVPNGIGFYGPDNDLFVTDNQGNWIGACKLNHVKQDQTYGFTAASPAPEDWWANPPSEFAPPAVWFPRKFSPSTAGFATFPDKGFGPFEGQMVVADFQISVALRVHLEKVNGEWQGTMFPFVRGFLSGANRLAFDPKGRLYVGGLKNQAWAAVGPIEQSLERVSWKGETPFSVKAVFAKNNGFELEFTKPQLEEFANNPESYFVSQFNYKHHETYGSPKFDHDGHSNVATEIKVTNAKLSEDGMKVRLTMDGLKAGYVTQFVLSELKGTGGNSLWHDEFFYTLNQIPRE